MCARSTAAATRRLRRNAVAKAPDRSSRFLRRTPALINAMVNPTGSGSRKAIAALIVFENRLRIIRSEGKRGGSS